MWGQPPGWQYADNSQDLPVHQPRREEQQKTWQKTSGLRLRNFGKKQKIPSPLQGSNTELSGATCYVQQPLAWVKNVKFTRKTWFSICPIWSSVFKFEPSSTDNMIEKPSSEKQSMMEDSRWSVESVTKQVVNPSLTCNIPGAVNFEQNCAFLKTVPFLLGPQSYQPQSLGRNKPPRSNCMFLSACPFLHLQLKLIFLLISSHIQNT